MRLVPTGVLLVALAVVGVVHTADPECDMDTTGIIFHWGYQAQEIFVTTEDGYVLTIHRIVGKMGQPPQPGRPVIFMQHGLECSSSNWVTNMPWESAGFMFSDAGFDVYLGNMRGNTYCKRHTTLDPKDEAFWAFTYDEMAKYDLPAMVDAVLQMTNQSSLYYMGHSQGTMIMFAKQATDRNFHTKIKKFFALAPVAKVTHIEGMLAWIAPFTNVLADILKLFGGWGEFLPSSWLVQEVAKTVCSFWVTDPLCEDILFLIAGADSHQLNESRIDVYLSHTPAGTSTQNIVHFGQGVNDDTFSMYDWTLFDKNGNIDHYGQDTPPPYDITKCSIPTYLYKGDMDILADPTDVQYIEQNVPNIVSSVLLTGFNHLDFIWGLNAAAEIYTPIINIIKEDVQQEKALKLREKMRV